MAFEHLKIRREINGETVEITLTSNEMDLAHQMMFHEAMRQNIMDKLEERGITSATDDEIEDMVYKLEDQLDTTPEYLDDTVEMVVEWWYPYEDEDEEGGEN